MAPKSGIGKTRGERVRAKSSDSDGGGPVLTPREAAAMFKVPEAAIIADAEASRLPGKRIGGEWRFSRAALLEWLSTPTRRSILDLPVSDETPEEFEAFQAILRANRDEIDRATGSGKYAPE